MKTEEEERAEEEQCRVEYFYEDEMRSLEWKQNLI